MGGLGVAAVTSHVALATGPVAGYAAEEHLRRAENLERDGPKLEGTSPGIVVQWHLRRGWPTTALTTLLAALVSAAVAWCGRG